MRLLDSIKSLLGISSDNENETDNQLTPEETVLSPKDSINPINSNQMKTSELLIKFLKEQGFMPQILDNGWILFKYQMRNFLHIPQDEDANFFQLSMPLDFEVTDDNREAVLEAANKISASLKGVKAVVYDGEVWLHSEILLDSTPILEDVVPRMLEALMVAFSEFGE